MSATIGSSKRNIGLHHITTQDYQINGLFQHIAMKNKKSPEDFSILPNLQGFFRSVR
jgi:hypothetical protein